MDNVLVDFQSGLDKVDEETKNRYRAKGPGDNSKLEKKVMAANRQNFIRNIREVNNRNNGMTDEEYRDMMHDRL
jgi:hypothetical protein